MKNYCSNCGMLLMNNPHSCPNCGTPVAADGQSTMQQNVYQHPPAAYSPSAKNRTAFILLGLFLGMLGIHNFYAGHTGKGLAQLLINLFLGWLIVPLFATAIWVIIEICTETRDGQGNPMT